MNAEVKVVGDEIEVAEKEPQPEINKDAEKLSEILDINILFGITGDGVRVPGKPGLYIPYTQPNKSGMIKMGRFMRDEFTWVKRERLIRMRGAVIFKGSWSEGSQDTITLAEAFDNLHEHYKGKPTGELLAGHQIEIMQIICPSYDPKKFKQYHAKKVIQFRYNILAGHQLHFRESIIYDWT